LQRLGRVLHISSTKHIILKAENVPRIGDKVVDADLQPVGTVYDIFGPTSSPYISVKTNLERAQHFIGHILYSFPSAKSRSRRRRKNN
jgi:rRNA processing protein Gar1